MKPAIKSMLVQGVSNGFQVHAAFWPTAEQAAETAGGDLYVFHDFDCMVSWLRAQFKEKA